MNDFKLIALGHSDGFPLLFRNNRPIALDRHSIPGQIEVGEEFHNVQRGRDLTRLTVQTNFDTHN